MVDFSFREECPDTVEGDAADVGVAGVVVDEVIPEDPAAGFGQGPHAVGQFLLKTVVQDRGKDRMTDDRGQRSETQRSEPQRIEDGRRTTEEGPTSFGLNSRGIPD